MKGVVFLMASEKWGGLQQAEMTWAVLGVPWLSSG